MRTMLAVLALVLVLPTQAVHAKERDMSLYDFEFSAIDGGNLPLEQYRGHPVLLVNTASFCGFTRQYADLQQLWQDYQGKGLVVLGVPSNDFGGQEPGSAEEIKDFCETNFDIDFPLTAKAKVIGPDAHPLYRWVAGELGEGGQPRWNFHKYLFDKTGALAGAWPSRVRPVDAEIRQAVDTALAEKPVE